MKQEADKLLFKKKFKKRSRLIFSQAGSSHELTQLQENNVIESESWGFAKKDKHETYMLAEQYGRLKVHNAIMSNQF